MNLTPLDYYLVFDEFMDEKIQGEEMNQINIYFMKLLKDNYTKLLFQQIFGDNELIDYLITVFERTIEIDDIFNLMVKQNKKTDEDITSFIRNIKTYPIFFYLVIGAHAIGNIIYKNDDGTYKFVWCNSGYGSDVHSQSEELRGYLYGIVGFDKVTEKTLIDIFKVYINAIQNEVNLYDVMIYTFLILKPEFKKCVDELADEKIMIRSQKSGSCAFRAYYMGMQYMVSTKLGSTSETIGKMDQFYDMLGLNRIGKIIDYLNSNPTLITPTIAEILLEKYRYFVTSYPNIDQTKHIQNQLYSFIDNVYQKERLDLGTADKINSATNIFELDKKFVLPTKIREPIKEQLVADKAVDLVESVQAFILKLKGSAFDTDFIDFFKNINASIKKLQLNQNMKNTIFEVLNMYTLRLPYLFMDYCHRNNVQLKKNKDKVWDLYDSYSNWLAVFNDPIYVHVYKFSFLRIFENILSEEIKQIFNNITMDEIHLTEKKYFCSSNKFNINDNPSEWAQTVELYIMRNKVKISTEKYKKTEQIGDATVDIVYNLFNMPIAHGLIYQDIKNMIFHMKNVQIYFNDEEQLRTIFYFIYNLIDNDPFIILDNYAELMKTDDTNWKTMLKSRMIDGKRILLSSDAVGLAIPKLGSDKLANYLFLILQVVYSCKCNYVGYLDGELYKTPSQLSYSPFLSISIEPNSIVGSQISKEEGIQLFTEMTFNPNFFSIKDEQMNTGFNISGTTESKLNFLPNFLKYLETEDDTYLIKGTIFPYVKYGMVGAVDDNVIQYIDISATSEPIKKEPKVVITMLEDGGVTVDKKIVRADKKNIKVGSEFNIDKSVIASKDILERLIDESTYDRIKKIIEKLSTGEMTQNKLEYAIFVLCVSYIASIKDDLKQHMKKILDETKLFTTDEILALSPNHQIIAVYTGFYVSLTLEKLQAAQTYLNILETIYKGSISEYGEKICNVKISAKSTKDSVTIVQNFYVTDNRKIKFMGNTKNAFFIHMQNYCINNLTSSANYSLEYLVYNQIIISLSENFFRFKPIFDYKYDPIYDTEVIPISNTRSFGTAHITRDKNIFVNMVNFFINKKEQELQLNNATIYYDEYDLSYTVDNMSLTVLNTSFISSILYDGVVYKNKYNFDGFWKLDFKEWKAITFDIPYFVGKASLLNQFNWSYNYGESTIFVNEDEARKPDNYRLILNNYRDYVPKKSGGGPKKGAVKGKTVNKDTKKKEKDRPDPTPDEIINWFNNDPNYLLKKNKAIYDLLQKNGTIKNINFTGYNGKPKDSFFDYTILVTEQGIWQLKANKLEFRLVTIDQLLKTPHIMGLITQLLQISNIDNMYIWEKNNSIELIELIDHKVKIIRKGQRWFLDNGMEIINSTNFITQRWVSAINNTILLRDEIGIYYVGLFGRINTYIDTNKLKTKNKNVVAITDPNSCLKQNFNKAGIHYIKINPMTNILEPNEKEVYQLYVYSAILYNSVGNVLELQNMSEKFTVPVSYSFYRGAFKGNLKGSKQPRVDNFKISLNKRTSQIHMISVSISQLFKNKIVRLRSILMQIIENIFKSTTDRFIHQQYNVYAITPNKNLFAVLSLFDINNKKIVIDSDMCENITGVFDQTNLLSSKNISIDKNLIKIYPIDIINEVMASVIKKNKNGKTAYDIDNINKCIISGIFSIYNYLTNLRTDDLDKTIKYVYNNKLPIMTMTNYKIEYKLNSLESMNESAFIRNYFFSENMNNCYPTLVDYYLFSLLDKTTELNGMKLSDVAFNNYFHSIKNKYGSSEEQKQEYQQVLARASANNGFYRTNPLEFYYQYIVGFFVRDVQQKLSDDIIQDVTSEQIYMRQAGGYSNVIHEYIKYSSNLATRDIHNVGHIHSLIMGGGKTKMITPLVILRYIQFNNILKLNKDKVFIVLPENLVNQSYTFLNSTIGFYFPIKVVKLIEDRTNNSDYTNLLNTTSDSTSIVAVMSDTSMKCGFINNYATIQVFRDKNIYLFDEIDTIMNPTISELNYPIGEKEKIRAFDDVFEPIFYAIYKIYSSSRDDEFTNLLNRYPLDWTDIPHFNVIDINSALVTEIIKYIEKLIINYFKDTKHLELVSIMQGTNQNHKITQHTSNILYVINNFLNECCPTILNLINRKNYGLDNSTDINIAIPFTYAEEPKRGSQFSNPVLIMSLTIIDYIVQIKPLRYDLIDKMIEIISSSYLMTNAAYRHLSPVFIEFNKLKIKTDLSYLRSTQQLTTDEVNLIRTNQLFLKYLLKVVCSDDIEIEREQYNIAGIDLVMSFNIKNKSSFTGTPSIPIFYDIADKLEIQEGDPESRKTIDIALSLAEYRVYPDTKQIEFLTTMMYDNKDASVLIDIGSIMIGVTAQQIHSVISKIKQIDQFIYWNDKDIPMVIEKSGQLFPWDGKITTHMFYFYDNKHTTGTDAFIPLESIGLALLGKGTRYRDLVQGIFRMRKLTKGHHIRYVLNQKLEDFIKRRFSVQTLSATTLTMWFNYEEERTKNSQQSTMSLQNLRAIFKYYWTKDLSKLKEIYQNSQMMKLKIENPFYVYNSFKYPDVEEDGNNLMSLIKGDISFTDIEIDELQRSFENQELYRSLVPKERKYETAMIQKQVIQQQIKIEIEEQMQLEMEVEEDISQRLNQLIKYDGDEPYNFKMIENYWDCKFEAYTKIATNCYFSKNLKFYLPPYGIIICKIDNKDTYFMIPFVELLKLIDTLKYRKINISDKIILTDILGNNYYSTYELTNKMKSMTRFIIRTISNNNYISYKDYMNTFNLSRELRSIVEELLALIITVDEIFLRFKSVYPRYNKYKDHIVSYLQEYNKLTEKVSEKCMSEALSIVNQEKDENIRGVLIDLIKFVTNDYRICIKFDIQQSGGSHNRTSLYHGKHSRYFLFKKIFN
jgi:hypothetical protein